MAGTGHGRHAAMILVPANAKSAEWGERRSVRLAPML